MSFLRVAVALPRAAAALRRGANITTATTTTTIIPTICSTTRKRAFTHFTKDTRARAPRSLQTQTPTGRRFVSGGAGPTTPKKGDNSFPVLPLVAIFLGGSGLFYLLVKQREGNIPERLKSKERG